MNPHNLLSITLFVVSFGACGLAEENFGKLIFQDDFERSESQELKDEPGNEWTTSSDKTAKGNKQVDLRDGFLHIYTHAEANHATSVRHAFEFKNGTIGLKVKFSDPGESLKLNFTDLAEKSVHAGHLFNVTVSPTTTTLTDLKTGVMNLELREAKKKGTLTESQKSDLKTNTKGFAHPLALEQWHQVYATVEEDRLTCTINGETVGEFRSPGIAHQTKTLIRLLVATEISVDEVRIWRQLEADLTTPVMTDDSPGAGKRVRQVAPEYEGTEVYHSLYLPTDWAKGRKYPVIVEYTGNKFPPANGSGEIKDANLGYGMSGGKGFIWVAMPYVEKGGEKNAVTWWGDKQATVDYCKVNLPRICEDFGGDPDNVFVCGFSRGAIGASYIGLADDEIAALWKGVFTHDHFDGQKKWGYPESDRESALIRLARLKGRPVHISCGGKGGSHLRDEYLKNSLGLAEFTFLDVPINELFTIPEGQFNHSHTDLWMHRDSEYRDWARAWLKSALK